VALVQGFGFSSRCAVATTVAHDCHQMVVVGTDDAEMARSPPTSSRRATAGRWWSRTAR